jgi:hypothetical protein
MEFGEYLAIGLVVFSALVFVCANEVLGHGR